MIGRFQPPHKGHVYAIKTIYTRHEKTGIAIPSYRDHTKENPLEGLEVKRLLFDSLRESNADLDRVYIFLFRKHKNSKMDPVEFSYREILRHMGKPILIYTGNKTLYHQLSDLGADVEFFERVELEEGLITGEKIRRRIAFDEEWEHLVLPGVAQKIKNRGLDEKIKNLYLSG